jgi:hypothetical protein
VWWPVGAAPAWSSWCCSRCRPKLRRGGACAAPRTTRSMPP